MSISAFDMEIAEGIKKIIDSDIQIHYSTGYLAEKAGMSENKLNEIFKQVAATTLFAYLQKKRMMQAATLLQDTTMRLKQISKQCGYRNYSNFSRAFKTHVGVAPLTYRNAIFKKNSD